MNILIFSWRGPGHPNAGGAEVVTHEHAKGWVKAGHSVTLFTSYFRGAKKKEILDGVKIIRRGNAFIGVRVEAFRWYRELKKKPDLVIDQFHGIPFFSPLFVKEKKLGFIHEIASEVWWMNHLIFPLNFIYAILGYFSEPLIFILFYRNIPFMTVSESTKKDLIKWGISRKEIAVVHNGITIKRVAVNKDERKTALFLGALSKDKGIEDALEVFALINKKDPSWKFWVVGKGEPGYIKKLKVQTLKLKIRNKIKFFGHVSERKKFGLLGRAHILLNPSVREGWGLVNIEASCVGTPIIGYDVPGIRDSVINNKTGILVSAGDTRKLALNCIELTKDRKKYEEFRKMAPAFGKKFNWKKSVRESLRLIEKICEK